MAKGKCEYFKCEKNSSNMISLEFFLGADSSFSDKSIAYFCSTSCKEKIFKQVTFNKKLYISL